MTNTVSETISDETLNRGIQIESAGKLKAKASTSTALGLFQFLNASWLDIIGKHRADLEEDRTRAQLLALRTDPTVAIELGARLWEDNAAALGGGFTDGDLYLAHFLGIGTARKFIRARANASAAAIAGAAAVNANRSILAGKTVGQVRAWAQNAMVHRWDAAGRPDWVKRYYDPNSPLAAAAAAPKAEDVVDDAADDQPAKVDPDDAPAPITQSKIAQAGAGIGALGLTGAVEAANSAAEQVKALQQNANEIGIADYVGHILTSPSLLIMVGFTLLAGLIIYWRWKDHGRGAVQ